MAFESAATAASVNPQPSLFENRLFLQYLSGAGAAMGSGQPVSGALNDITQQNISAQSKASLNEKYMKILKDMLEGKVAPGNKLSLDENGMKVQFSKLDPEGKDMSMEKETGQEATSTPGYNRRPLEQFGSGDNTQMYDFLRGL